MRTTTTKSFTIALVLATVLATPTFAARDDAKRQPGSPQQQEQTLVQRVLNRVRHLLDLPGIPIPTSAIAPSSGS